MWFINDGIVCCCTNFIPGWSTNPVDQQTWMINKLEWSTNLYNQHLNDQYLNDQQIRNRSDLLTNSYKKG